jgi:hypothetical protein
MSDYPLRRSQRITGNSQRIARDRHQDILFNRYIQNMQYTRRNRRIMAPHPSELPMPSYRLLAPPPILTEGLEIPETPTNQELPATQELSSDEE